MDGGGGTTGTGGIYGLGGTIGQPDAGAMSGGIYSVQGGFWVVPAADARLVAHVIWQGPPAQPNVRQQLPVTLTLKLGTTEVNYLSQSTDPSGFFTVTVSNLPNGTYNWRVKGTRYLANSGVVALTGAAVTNAEMSLMRAGDANNDNLVSAVDFSILRSAFGGTTDLRADFNNDGLVSSVDFNLLRGNFGMGGAPPLAPGRK